MSVIIPTYNRPDNLFRAVESVVNQTEQPKEIIIVDDNSENEIIVKGLPNSVPIVYHRFSENKGACAARNKGAELASGNILMFLDDDDTWEREKIASQLKIFENGQYVGLVYTGRKIVTESNRDKVLYKISPKKRKQIWHYHEILLGNFIGTTSSVAIRKSLFELVGGFDEKLPAMQDYDLWIRVCKKSKVFHDEQVNVRYTVSDNPSKQISGNPDKYKKASLYILDKYSNEINSLGFFKKKIVKSNRYFSIAKTYKKKSFLNTLYWSLKSFVNFPNLKALALLFPLHAINIVRKSI